MANHTLLEEFKELIEEITEEVISEVHMRDLAQDVVSRSYKNEVQEALGQLSGQVEEAEKNVAAIKTVYVEDVTKLIEEVKAEITVKVSQEIGQVNSKIEKIIEKVVGDYEIRMMGVLSQKVDTLEQRLKQELNQGLQKQEINYLAETGGIRKRLNAIENQMAAKEKQEAIRLQKEQEAMNKKFKLLMFTQGITLLMLIVLVIYMVSGYGA